MKSKKSETNKGIYLMQLSYFPEGDHLTINDEGWNYFSTYHFKIDSIANAKLEDGKHRLWFITYDNSKDLKKFDKILKNSAKPYIVHGLLNRPETQFSGWRPEVICHVAKKVNEKEINEAVKILQASNGNYIQIGRELDIDKTDLFLPEYQEKERLRLQRSLKKEKSDKINEFFTLSKNKQKKYLEGLL